MTDEDFDAVIATHLRGTFTCARTAARNWREAREGCRLILVSSIAGQRGNCGQTACSAAKAGIAAMARTWSMELAKAGVTVNAIVPSALTRMVATIPSLAPYVGAAERGEPLPERVRADLGLGTAADVAPLFVWLASDGSAGVTGQCIGIGGTDCRSGRARPRRSTPRPAAGRRRRSTRGGIGVSPETVGVTFEL